MTWDPMKLDLPKLVSTIREELEEWPDEDPRHLSQPAVQRRLRSLIDREATRALEDVDVRGCLLLLLAGELPCVEAVNRITPCSTFLSPTYIEAIKAAAWVLVTDHLDNQLEKVR